MEVVVVCSKTFWEEVGPGSHLTLEMGCTGSMKGHSRVPEIELPDPVICQVSLLPTRNANFLQFLVPYIHCTTQFDIGYT